MARFVKASMKGWDYARANPDEAAQIVLDNDETGAQTEEHQMRMMGEINKLHRGLERLARRGRLRAHRRDPALGGGSDPVITKKPEGAFTHAVTEKAAMFRFLRGAHAAVVGSAAFIRGAVDPAAGAPIGRAVRMAKGLANRVGRSFS